MVISTIVTIRGLFQPARPGPTTSSEPHSKVEIIISLYTEEEIVAERLV